DYLWRKHGHEKRLVIPDVRFKNEYGFLMSQGAVAVRVIADVRYRSERPGYDEEFENDPTETELKDMPVDYTLINNGSVLQLFSMVDQMMWSLAARRKSW